MDPTDPPAHEMPSLHKDEPPDSPAELPSHCDGAEYGISSSSGDIAPAVLTEEASASMAADFETTIAVAETGDMAVEESSTMTVEAVDGGGGPVKRKRGRPRKNPEAKAVTPARKKEREDVCFVCFDPRNPILVGCNRRGCYKAYHPGCVNREDAFFRSKGKWNCGWHICSNCQKAAHYMCYTCTTSYCKECVIDESKYVCVRGTYGFCQSCHNTVTLIELNKLAFEKKDGSDFDDTDSFTYLFKAYWLDRKGKLSLTSEELSNARHPYSVAPDEDSSDESYDVNEDQGSSSESSSDHKSNISSKKKARSRSQAFAVDKNPEKEVDAGGTVMLQETGWASIELLELVAHMRNGDQSFISQFDVQALLLDYIKKYNLRDPRRKSQIICDLRLRNLFGKERVGHFEMLKLLESHFLSKEVQVVVDDKQVETSDTDNKLTDDVEEGDTFARVVSEKRRKNRKRTEEIEPLMNVDDYAAVDVHNITHIFLRRSLLEDLLDDIETFNDKVVGSFVRIRISNAGQRQDLYRLVQIIGTQESSKPYKVGKKTTDIVLEILNLNKKETSTIDSISNQDFTEEECQRLRQSIKCGLIERLKVGYIQEKAKVLHAVRVIDSIEAEKLRLSHLRDRASETGRRKELRECVEKLQLLNNPEERRRRLNEVPQIHADPKMDPEYESSEEGEDDKNQDYQMRSKEVLSLRKKRELIPRGRAGAIGNNWNGRKSPNFNRESSIRMQGEVWQDRSDMYNNMAERPNEVLLNQSKEVYQTDASFTGLQTPSPGNYAPKSLGHNPHGSAPEINSVTPEGSLPSITNEVDKIWHYQDPSMNIQGPFSISQLRKWNTTGYFPPDLRIWRTSEKQEDSKLLADVLAGRFCKDPPQQVTQHGSVPHQPMWVDRQQNRGNWNAHPNINQPTLEGLASPPPIWSLPGVEVSSSSEGKPGTNSSTWSNNPRPAGPIYNNPYHIPIYQEAGRGGNGSGWSQEQDYGNIWSPTRPKVGMPVDNPKVEDNLTSDPSIVSASSSANELNGHMNKYQSYESDCPSPTPRTERKESFLRHDEPGSAKNWSDTLDRMAGNSTTLVGNLAVNPGPAAAPLGTLDSSLASHSAHPAIINFESSNTASAVGLTDKIPGTGMQKLDGSKSVSNEFQNNLSPIVATADDIGSGHAQRSELSSIQKIETGFQAMDHASALVGLSITQSLHGMEHDQSQNPKQNFSPIHQVNPPNASEVESSLPSPTPKGSKNTWGIDASSASSNVSSQNQKLQTVQNANASWGGAPQGNIGWGTAAYMNANANTGWGTLVQGNSNANTSWGTAAHGNATANTGWGTLITNANTGWGTPVQGNANAGWGTPVPPNANTNTGWGLPVQLNVNTNTAWGTPAQGNANAGWGTAPQGNGWGTNSTTTGFGNSNPGATEEAIPMHDDNASLRAGWGSAYVSRNGSWKSSDRDTSRRFDYESRNGDGYSRHRDRDMGRHGGSDPRNSRLQSGGRGGSSRPHQASTGGDGQRGVCKFYESGHCKKGRSCKYLHTDPRRDI